MGQRIGTWKRAASQDLPRLLDYLLPQEWRAVPFTSRLLRQGQAFLPNRLDGTVGLLVAPSGGPGAGSAGPSAVSGAFLRTAGGLVLPVMPYLPDPEREARLAEVPVPRDALRPLAGGRVYSIMGPAAEVRWLEGAMGFQPAAWVEYALMTLNEEDFRPCGAEDPSLLRSLKVRQADIGDLNRLFPLQKAYELEEVVVFPDRFTDQSCRLNLRRTLRQQLVLVAELHGRAVAKAGTNARGFHADQIGGVYTVEELRGGGIAAVVMSELLERIFRARRTVSLFVKTANRPALGLYRKLGFRSLDAYRISYLQG